MKKILAVIIFLLFAAPAFCAEDPPFVLTSLATPLEAFYSAPTQTASIADFKLQLFDNSGKVCAGCKLYAYLAGTTTAHDTYTDYQMSSANANPVVADAYGRVNVWLDSVSYKFVLTTSAGVTLWTLDNISDIGLLLKNDLASTTSTSVGDALIGYKATGTGAVARTVHDRLKDGPASVQDYGAKCDGKTDDTAAIQAALNATYGAVYVPYGCTVKGGGYSGLSLTVAQAFILDFRGPSVKIAGKNAGDTTIVAYLTVDSTGSVGFGALSASTITATGAASVLSLATTGGNVAATGDVTATGNVVAAGVVEGGTAGIGTSGAPDASAALEVKSTIAGFLPPRMSATERGAIASPATGLVVYDTSNAALYVYNGSTWEKLTTSTNQSWIAGTTSSISDGDTVTHGLGSTPSQVLITATDATPTAIYVDTLTSSTFKVHFTGGGTAVFSWIAIK